MKQKSVLEAVDAARALEAACAEAAAQNWAVSVAVVDDGGHLLAFRRLNGSSPISSAIAIEKARTAALGRRESKVYEDSINGGRTAFLSAPLVGLLEGGVPVIVAGDVVGAVGVSGLQAAQDAQAARVGADAAAAQ